MTLAGIVSSLRVTAPVWTILPFLLASCAPAQHREASGGVAQPAIQREGFDPSGIVMVAARTPVRHSQPTVKSDQLTASERTLLPFFTALKGLETGARKEPVTILQIGDSHTAGDFLSGQMRTLLQAKFGTAGRGIVPPGLPDKYYRPDLIQVAESDHWQRTRAANPDTTEKFGVAGVIQRAAGPRQTMTLSSTEDTGFNHGFVEVLGPGKFNLTVDAAPPRSFDLSDTAPQGEWIEFDVPEGSHALKLDTIDNSPVTLLSWGIQRQKPGILYSNLGTIGATSNLIGRFDAGVVQSELQHVDPALIIVAFGTNEAFGNPGDLANFRNDFISNVNVLAKAAPGAAIVIVGPPDVNRRYRRPAGVSGECTTRPLAEAALTTTPTQPAHPASKKGRAARGTVWAPPPVLNSIRADERAAAEANGWYFWDWEAAMGGPCAAHRWTLQETPLSRPDHVHQTIAGYQLTAERLFTELMRGYDSFNRYEDKHPAPLKH
jgi:lysophospholipase L1-like esterase